MMLDARNDFYSVLTRASENGNDGFKSALNTLNQQSAAVQDLRQRGKSCASQASLVPAG